MYGGVGCGAVAGRTRLSICFTLKSRTYSNPQSVVDFGDFYFMERFAEVNRTNELWSEVRFVLIRCNYSPKKFKPQIHRFSTEKF